MALASDDDDDNDLSVAKIQGHFFSLILYVMVLSKSLYRMSCFRSILSTR